MKGCLLNRYPATSSTCARTGVGNQRHLPIRAGSLLPWVCGPATWVRMGTVATFRERGLSRYDYLSLRQTEPALAEAFYHADAVPRNTLRGDGARRYLARVSCQETHATAKLGAADRGFVYPHRGGRA